MIGYRGGIMCGGRGGGRGGERGGGRDGGRGHGRGGMVGGMTRKGGKSTNATRNPLKATEASCIPLKTATKFRTYQLTRAQGQSLASDKGSSLLNTYTPYVFSNNASSKVAEQAVLSSAPRTDDEILAFLIKFHTFEGSWTWNSALFDAIGVSETTVRQKGADAGAEDTQWVTALVIAFFEKRLGALKGSWELVVEKARVWLQGKVGTARVEDIVGKTRAMV
jgi:hypothetical protein